MFLILNLPSQLSTRDMDYVIDTIALRSHMGLLLDAFTDPHLVKVFHGCNSDIVWLQRDFGLFVVNCFDTYHASKLLKYPALSLAHLLKFYCGQTVNKKHQLADWRQRPLPKELIQYARDDTHNLLYVYDCLRRDIFREHGLVGLRAVFDASRKTCLNRYQKEEFDSLGYLQLFQDARKNRFKIKATDLTPTQDSILMSLWEWRDFHARNADESPAFIMSNSELLRLGMLSQLPRTTSELAQAGHPLSAYVLKNLDDLLRVIRGALYGNAAPRGDHATTTSTTTPTGKSTSQQGFRVGFYSVRGPTSGVSSRFQDLPSVCTFTPTIDPVPHSTSVPPLSNGRRMGLHRGTPSPLSEQNIEADIKGLLQKAGWVPHMIESECNIKSAKPTVNYGYREPPNPHRRAAYEKACSLIKNESAAAASLYAEEISDSDSDSDESDKMEVVDGADLVDDDMKVDTFIGDIIPPPAQSVKKNFNTDNDMDLPKSLSEIYNLSNYKRKNRNRDKKRDRTGEIFEADTTDASAKSKAEALYFNKKVAALSSDGPVSEAVRFYLFILSFKKYVMLCCSY